MGQLAPIVSPATGLTPMLWSGTTEELPKPAASPPAVATATNGEPAPAATVEASEEKPSTAAPTAEAQEPSAGEAAGASSAASGGGEGLPLALPEGATDSAQQASPTTPVSGLDRSPVESPGGGASSWNSDYVNPNRTWANIVNKNKDLEEAAGRQASSSSGAPARREDDARSRKDSIIDYLLLLARCKAELEGRANGHTPELPEEVQGPSKFKQATEAGVSTNGRAKYNRRGMKNDANNCYVNVVIQSLLPCSALMQLLSHCGPDTERPFYSGMVRLCKEFHSRKTDSHAEALNVLNLPQVKRIISTWQQLGAQQDAGEFLFHLLNGLHEECKWKSVPEEGLSTSDEGAGADAAGDGDVANQVRPDVRAAGEHEDSPIFRIFGGIIRSSVQEKNKKADSVSLEPFNGLILDISSSSVDSVWSALEAYCGTEAINEGRATKRLQFKAVPKVMTLNLKRFSYNKDTGCSQKIRKVVKFEERITFDRSWLVDELEPQEYQLTAVICHHGDLISGGHYNAAVRYNSDWYMYDDVSVRQIDIREVLSLAASVYLLLYQCNERIDIRP
jgi:ubiquitin C-terminal hydrolase